MSGPKVHIVAELLVHMYSYTHIHIHIHTHKKLHTCSVRHYMYRKTFKLQTYGYQIQRKPIGASLRENISGEVEENIYSRGPEISLTADGDKEPVESIPLTTLIEHQAEEEAEQEAEEKVGEFFSNEAATESREEIQVLNLSFFDEIGEETKL